MSTWCGHTLMCWQKTQRELLRGGGGRTSVWPSPSFIHPITGGICGISQELVSGLSPPWCWVSALPHAPAVSLHLFEVIALPQRWPLWPSPGQALQWLSSMLWVSLFCSRTGRIFPPLAGWVMFCVGAHHLLSSHSLPRAPGWDAGEDRFSGPCRSPQGGDVGMRHPLVHTTTGNMGYIPVMGVGNKGALWAATRGQLFRPS